MSSKVLVIGSGGREHALCWKLSQSSKIGKIFALPGNVGIEQVKKVELVKDINAKNFQEIANWCLSKTIDLVVVGPEDPLANGIGDVLDKASIKCFGPSQKGALIESDKKWAKDFMIRHEIPTARFDSFTETDKAKDFLKNAGYNALVVKASGLAAGKGVVVANNSEEACSAVDEILGSKKFGSAGDVIVIEEKLVGEEISVLGFVDSHSVRLMLPAQDHKRLKENDEGPNTGGMGAYCPCLLISDSQLKTVKEEIMQRAVDGLRKEGINYCGVLYAGLMLTADGPKVLEFNCRFGDPETQVILPLLESDLFEVMLACCENRLNQIELKFKNNISAVGVVMASAGYPETSTKGCVIDGIPNDTESTIIYHSGIAVNKSGKFVTNGGRVLIAVHMASDLKKAAIEATKVCENIKFVGAAAQFRNDIAQKAFKFLTLSYKDSGVDIDAGDDLVQRIKPLARGTNRSGVLGAIGGFGGLFRLNKLQYRNPMLCEVTRGVGAKIKMALDCELYDAIGYDLVAECVNQVLESGAEPVAFLDYIACGKLQVTVAAQIIKGISEGCRDSNCALLGGETAEMPSIYSMGKYDLAGYCLGILENGSDLPKFETYEDGDLIIGLPSTGLHCSNFAFIYEVVQRLGLNLKDKSEFGDKNKTFGQEFLRPAKVYVKELLPLVQSGVIKSLVYIHSGLTNCVKRIIPSGYEMLLNAEKFNIPEIYGWLASNAEISHASLLDTFNCGIGMIFVVSKTNQEWINISNAAIIGKLIKRETDPLISVENFTETINRVCKKICKLPNIKKTVSISQCLSESESKEIIFNSDQIELAGLCKSQSGKLLRRVPKIYHDPILVIGTDGVGTKVKIAQQLNLHSTVGIDLVAMCANDILCNGAKPLTFLCYYVGGQIDSETISNVFSGVLDGCQQAESVLIDNIMTSLPLLYRKNVYDLAGFALGICEHENMLPKLNQVCPGDVVIGIPSSGIHSNGFSLVHKIIEYAGVSFEDKTPYSEKTFGEEMLTPTRIYVDAIKPLLEVNCIKALAHITGGGLLENIPRVLIKDLAVKLDANTFNILPIFGWLSDNGNVSDLEMQRTYNCGIGMILIVSQCNEKYVLENLHLTHGATKIGHVIKRISPHEPQVVVENFTACIKRLKETIKRPKKRVAVLISGSGTNLQALIDTSQSSAFGMGAEIVLVISNKQSAYGLERAKNANISTVVISHRKFKKREEFDNEMTKVLHNHSVELVCLAGFMRILSEEFVKHWEGKLLNIHPSLLPKYPGLHVQQKALEAGEKESGCTVHFVDEGVDTGSIIIQEKVKILPNDDVETLTKRIQKAEHYAFPVALRLVATGALSFKENTD